MRVCVVADSAGKLFLIEFCDRLETKEGQSGGPAVRSRSSTCGFNDDGGPSPLSSRSRYPLPRPFLVFSRLVLPVDARNR